MNLQELQQVKQDLANGIIISRSQWVKVLDAAISYGDCLSEYANTDNWLTNEDNMLQIWNEPGSKTPEAYHGCELAQKALSKTE
jgi:uncharacterized protein YaeQ